MIPGPAAKVTGPVAPFIEDTKGGKFVDIVATEACGRMVMYCPAAKVTGPFGVSTVIP